MLWFQYKPDVVGEIQRSRTGFSEILHSALRDGVAPVEVAAVADMTVDDLAYRWHVWARHVWRSGQLPRAEYEWVNALLVDANR